MMGRRTKVLPGLKLGKLTVVSRDPSGTSRHPKFIVQCDCGSPEYLTSGGTLYSLGGCRACAKMGKPPKYGDTAIQGTRLYNIWTGMRHRCRKHPNWAGKGIVVCVEWDESYDVFSAWAISTGYAEGLSIDRVDVDGNYEPSNCEWVTKSVNSKRCRAEYNFVRKKHVVRPIVLDAADSIAFAISNGVML